MGWFSDQFGGCKKEKKELKNVVRTLSKEMDSWVRNYPNDGTPPNEEQCKKEVDEKIAEILKSYDPKVHSLGKNIEKKCPDLVEEYKAQLQEDLDDARGDLYRKFSRAVDNLEAAAGLVMKECVKKLARKENEIKGVLPINPETISAELEEMVKDLEDWIGPRYPEGLTGLDNYDDKLPDGIPSWDDFKKQVAAKEEELKGLNEEAIPAAVEALKGKTMDAVKKQIDDAIRSTLEAVKEDLSDDHFAFLSEDATVELRTDLIALAEEHCNARLS